MKRKNATRSALFTSIISLLLCVSMLVGTTFAWFTDSVVSGTNVIAAGNLDVELYYSKDKEVPISNDNKVDGATLLFTDKDGNEIKHWEPGVVAYTNLKVANVGTLALTYRMTLNFDIKNYVEHEGKRYDLSDVLQVAIVEGGFKGDRAAAHALPYDYSLDSFHLAGELEGNTTTETIGVVIYWKPGTNEHDNLFNMNNGKKTSDEQPLRVELGINLFATQEEYEKDSFDELYDEEADLVIADGEVLTFDNETFNGLIENNGTVDISKGTMTNDGAVLTNNGNATVTDTTMEMTSGTGYITNSRGDDSVTIFENVDATSTGGGINVWEGEAIFKSGTVTTNSTSTSARHVFYVAAGGVLTIEDGEFTFSPTNLTRKGSYLCAEGEGATIYVKGGTFHKPSTRTAPVQAINGGKVIITGGKFAWDPTKWVALGYEAVKGTDGYWTVSAIPPVEDNTSLSDAIAAGETEIVLGSGTYIIPASAQGKTLTIIGNGESTVAVTKVGTGGENCDYGLDGSNVTFENVTITTNSSTYIGYARCNGTYNNCTFDGTYTLYGDSTFNNCTFNVSGDVYNIWTWGAPTATFNNCTFNSDGKAMLLYGTENTKLTLNGCTFNDKGGLTDLKAAVEIGNDYSKSYELIVNNTTVNGYEINDKGIVTGTTLWSNKNSMSGEKLSVTVDGVAQAWDATGVAKALTSDAKNVSVKLVKDVEVPISSLGTITGGSGEYKLGGDSTETITIDLNGKKLNIATTYWSNLGAKNDAALFTIKNGSMTSSQATGTWNSYDVTFSNCDYVIENVVFDKAIAFDNAGKSVKLNNVTVNETHDYYAIWICAAGMDVEIDGLTVNSTGRGIKIDEQYVGTPEKVTLKVANATFTTAKKAAIMVKSAAGADITLENVNIANVAADTTNVVWVDADAAAYADKVTVAGGSVITES